MVEIQVINVERIVPKEELNESERNKLIYEEKDHGKRESK